MAAPKTPLDELHALSKRCWKTSSSRFEASRRMGRCKNASTLCVAMLSVEIIVINLLIFIPRLNLDEDVVTVVTVCLSTFVLALSLIISQLKYERREDSYHLCGIRLADLEKRINIFEASGTAITYKDLSNFNDEYQSILRESNLNHSEIDMQQALRNSVEFKNSKIWLYIRWHFFKSDSIYNLLSFLGVVTVVLVILYGKNNDLPLISDNPKSEIIYFNNAYNKKP